MGTSEGIRPPTQILILCCFGLCQSPHGSSFIWFLQPVPTAGISGLRSLFPSVSTCLHPSPAGLTWPQDDAGPPWLAPPRCQTPRASPHGGQQSGCGRQACRGWRRGCVRGPRPGPAPAPARPGMGDNQRRGLPRCSSAFVGGNPGHEQKGLPLTEPLLCSELNMTVPFRLLESSKWKGCARTGTASVSSSLCFPSFT